MSVLTEPEYRVEGPLKVTGAARYTADVTMPGMLWLAYTRSPHPHARIVSVDTSAAQAVPGVHAVLTGKDTASARIGRRLQDWPVLATDRVRMVGDRVAAVAAESREAAEAAAQLVEVEYQELPGVFDVQAALADDAPILHPDIDTYTFLGPKRPATPHPNVHGYSLIEKSESGERIEDVFLKADHVFEHTFTTAREFQGFIEPRACVVWIDEHERLRIICTNKSPAALRQQLSAALGLPEERIVLDVTFIGGDFGGKGLSIDEYVCYFLARATGRPIKSVMSYVDELQASNSRHATIMRLKTAVDRDGKFLAHQSDVLIDGGAYAAGKVGPTLVVPAHNTLSGYHVPVTRLEARAVYTNSIPGGSMRAPGDPQSMFASESHVDMIAHALGIDPIELRRRNALHDGDPSVTGERVHRARAIEVLDALERESNWQSALPPGRGRGVALGIRHIGAGNASVIFRLAPGGRVEVLTGVADQGGGAYTVLRRVAAEVLSVSLERVFISHCDTSGAAPDPGVGGQRVTHVLGRAAQAGATELKLRLEDLAAEAMGWPVSQVRLEADRFVSSESSASFEEVAAEIERGAPVEVLGEYEGTHKPGEPGEYEFAGYVVDVAVDRETGAVTVHDVLLVADVGTIINPLAHQGQLEGGLMFGIGAALMEELTIQDGQVTTVTLGDYKLPCAMDTPPFRTVLLHDDSGPGPLGAKAAGELTNTSVAPAVANAVFAASGARVQHMPLTAERVLAALDAMPSPAAV
ncbi:MAG TPA: xanthine dehydrogenase family protein molybdopterin-binding subunit [Chloroflexota bacterium]|nr:xanthine dehydrogenase family protein molybdopterin-binding subunit [Chloroflexota bacterium]